jgi:hypothetical protein
MNNFAIWPKVQFGLYLAQIVVQPAHVVTRHVFGGMSEPPTPALDVAAMPVPCPPPNRRASMPSTPPCCSLSCVASQAVPKHSPSPPLVGARRRYRARGRHCRPIELHGVQSICSSMPPLFQSSTTAPPLLCADLEAPVFRPLPPPWTAVAGAARPQPPAAVARRPRATSTRTDSAGGRAGQPRCRPTRPLPSPAAAGPRPARPCLLPPCSWPSA